MAQLDARSQGLFDHYKAISNKIKKRLLKKPNYREASDEYGKLANSLKNDENSQYASLCFSAMAKCDQMMDDIPGEAEAWANAGRQFFQAEEILFLSRSASYEESLEAAVQCFSLAIQAQHKKGNNVMAAMFCLELGHWLKKLRKYHEAIGYFQKAADFQSDVPECQLHTLFEIASCKLQLREHDSALGILSRIVRETTDGKGGGGASASLHRRCEITVVLLLLSLQFPRKYMKPEHTLLLDKYTRDLSITGALHEDVDCSLLVLLQSLIVAVEEKDCTLISAIQPQLWSLLDPIQQNVLYLLTETHSHTVRLL